MNNSLSKSAHQLSVEKFMAKAGQLVRSKPVETIPEKERILSAKLLMEECLETITRGLGVKVTRETYDFIMSINNEDLMFEIAGPDNAVEVIDGVADVHVIATGIASRYGVNEAPVIYLVDENNLAKYGPGHTIREDGKLIKPPNHTPPDISGELKRQRETTEAKP